MSLAVHVLHKVTSIYEKHCHNNVVRGSLCKFTKSYFVAAYCFSLVYSNTSFIPKNLIFDKKDMLNVPRKMTSFMKRSFIELFVKMLYRKSCIKDYLLRP